MDEIKKLFGGINLTWKKTDDFRNHSRNIYKETV